MSRAASQTTGAGAPSVPATARAAGPPVWRHLLVYWAPVIVYLAVIFAGSSVSKLPDIPGGLSDKTAHAGEYAVLGFLLARALAGPGWLAIRWVHGICAVVLATLYGVSDECHQLFVPGRQFDVIDMAADAIGASAGASSLWAWGIIRRFWAVSARRP